MKSTGGWTFDEIGRLTLAQVRGYLEAADLAHRRKLISDAIALRMAQVEDKDWKAYMRGLQHGVRPSI